MAKAGNINMDVIELANKLALESYPNRLDYNGNTHRKYFIEGFLRGIKDAHSGKYIRYQIKYSYVYNRYEEEGTELHALSHNLYPYIPGVRTEVIDYDVRQLFERGYQEAGKYV